MMTVGSQKTWNRFWGQLYLKIYEELDPNPDLKRRCRHFHIEQFAMKNRVQKGWQSFHIRPSAHFEDNST